MIEEGLHKDHRKRMREKVTEFGIDTLRDHELLEMVLGYAIPRKNTNEIAHLLLNEYGTFRDLFHADLSDLQNIDYMGENSAWFIRLLSELFRRYTLEFFEGPLKMDTARDRIEYFKPLFMGRREECVYAAFLNPNREVIHNELLYVGSAEAVEIRTERLFQILERTKNCGYVMLAHNHFHSTVPSLYDFAATRTVYNKLDARCVTLLDHVIICGHEGSSMKESGHLEKVIKGELPQ